MNGKTSKVLKRYASIRELKDTSVKAHYMSLSGQEKLVMLETMKQVIIEDKDENKK